MDIVPSDQIQYDSSLKNTVSFNFKNENDFNEYLSSKLLDSDPQYHQLLRDILDLSKKKLYHNLTDSIMELIKDDFIQDHQKFLCFRFLFEPFRNKIDLTKFALTFYYASTFIDPFESLKFCDYYQDLFNNNLGAQLIFLCNKAENKIKCKDYKESENILDSVYDKIERHNDIEIIIFSVFYRSRALLYKNLKRHLDFYQNTVLYLSYTPIENLSLEERKDIAYDLSITALISNDIFEFAELLELPITKDLNSSENRWLHELLEAFCNGSLQDYHNLLQQYQDSFNSSGLIEHKQVLDRKIVFLALLEFVFNKPKNLRTIKFVDIADHLKVPINDVERILMSSMNCNLIKGKINEVEQVVNITYMKPRILNKARLKVLRERINVWSKTAEEFLLNLERITPELLAL